MERKPLRIGIFDSEQDGLADVATRTWCIVVKDRATGERSSYGPDAIDAGLAHIDQFDVLVGHNIIGHDFRVFRKLYGWEPKGKMVDTLIVSRVQRPNRKAPPDCPVKNTPHSINAWGYRVGRGKVEHNDWTQFSPQMLHRCEEDVEINDLVFTALMEEGKGEGWGNAHKLNMRLFYLLTLQEDRGWYADRTHIDNCINQLNRWIVRIDTAAFNYLPVVLEVQEDTDRVSGEVKHVRKPFNKDGSYSVSARNWLAASPDTSIGGPFSRVHFRRVSLDSNKETKEMLLSFGWQPLEWNTNDDGKRTSPKLSKDDPFEGIQGSLGRLIAKRVKCCHRRGVLEGLRDVIREDGTISPGFSGLATTGRLKHATIVNIPSVDSGSFYGRHMRACFITRPGFVMVGSDSKGNQIRQLAARMGDDEFTKVVLFGTKENKDDLHAFNQKLSGVATRTLAKNFFYGLIFGAQAPKIGKVIGGSREDGQRLLDYYFERLPKLKNLIDELAATWAETATNTWDYTYKKWQLKDGYIKGLDGRPILVDTQHKILNYALQSDEAIQMGYAYILVHDWMAAAGYKLGVDWNMLIWYHDEFQGETRPELKDILGSLMAKAIKVAGEYFKIACPHEGEYKVGQSWADTH